MIAKMLKVFVVVRASEKERLLTALRDLGVIHLAAVDPAKAHADEKTLAAIHKLSRAEQIVATIEPADGVPEADALQLAEQVLDIYTRAAEDRIRLASLQREADRLTMWGDVRLEQFDQLRQSGWDVRLVSVPAADVEKIPAACSAVVARGGAKRSIVAIVLPAGQEVELPDSAEPVMLPERDRPSVLAEAKAIDERLKADAEALARLAGAREAMIRKREELIRDAAWTIADRGGSDSEDLYAVQGWVPADQMEALRDGLDHRGLVAAIESFEPAPDEQPPTLLCYPEWAKPIKVLFDILGTTPGYREIDLSGFFMIALPIFAAMLIGDAGYGLVFTVAAFAARRKIIEKAGLPASQLLSVFALVTTAWGLLTGNIFGVSPADMLGAGGLWAIIGQPFKAIALLWDKDPDVARNIIIKVSFIFGSLHLVLAHLRQALALAPNTRWLSEIGWSAFLTGMLGVVWLLFFPTQIWMPTPVMNCLLIGGFVLVLLFSHPHRNPVVRIGMGLLVNLLPSISTFSDTMSYIRLMAVGLASYYIASAFNGLAGTVAGEGGFLYVPAALILILAHSLNIVLGIIAIFAHGVRLNMLEFSSNAGVQWEGYPYSPFGQTTSH